MKYRQLGSALQWHRRFFPINNSRWISHVLNRFSSASSSQALLDERRERILTLCCRHALYLPTGPKTSIFKRMVQGVAIVEGSIVNINPSTGEEISRVVCTTPEEVEKMMELAKETQPKWAAVPTKERIAFLSKGLKALASKSEDLATMMVKEMGKPLSQAKEEVAFATGKDEFLQVLEKSLKDEVHGSNVVVRQALGVVVVLSPWNFPADEILLLLLPALASGNTCIVKPSEVVPETGALVVKSLMSVLPEPGVLQLAQGDGSVGKLLVNHPATSLIAMTGSSATGKAILSAAAANLKRVVLELGGKDPMIVLDDCDIDAAAKDAVEYSLSNSGQVCCSIERIFVAQSIYDEFCKKVAEIAAAYKVGDGMDPNSKVGPLVSAMQKTLVAQHVEDAVANGAKVLHKSSIPTDGPYSTGNFYPVTVLANVQPGMKVYQEETFGPVVSLTPFDGTDETAVKLGNDTVYGLAASIYTSNMERADKIARQLQTGQVGINCYSLEHLNVNCPWVGHKNSGYGYHSGPDGFHQFSLPKTLVYKSS